MFDRIEINLFNAMSVRELRTAAPKKYFRCVIEERDGYRKCVNGSEVHFHDDEPLIQALGEALEYVRPATEGIPSEIIMPYTDGVHELVDLIRIHNSERQHFMYELSAFLIESNRQQGHEILERVVVTCLDDLTVHPEKIQKVAALIFTPEVKAAYIASLPTVDVKVAGETTTETVKVPAVTEKQVVDGVLTDVVIEEAREEKREVQATQAFIQYKGELYASARDLL